MSQIKAREAMRRETQAEDAERGVSRRRRKTGAGG